MNDELFALIVLAVTFAGGYLFGLDGKKRRHPRSADGQFKAKNHADSN